MALSALLPSNLSVNGEKVVQPHVAVHTKYGNSVSSNIATSSFTIAPCCLASSFCALCEIPYMIQLVYQFSTQFQIFKILIEVDGWVYQHLDVPSVM